MTAIEQDHTIAVCQELHAVAGVHSRSVCCTFRVEGMQKVHRQHAARINVSTVPERLGQQAAVCVIDVV